MNIIVENIQCPSNVACLSISFSRYVENSQYENTDSFCRYAEKDLSLIRAFFSTIQLYTSVSLLHEQIGFIFLYIVLVLLSHRINLFSCVLVLEYHIHIFSFLNHLTLRTKTHRLMTFLSCSQGILSF